MDGARILWQLAELRRPRARLFGAETHAYALAHPVDPALLARVEAALHAPLPDEYRRFLLEIGNGGAGLYHGLLSLEEAIARCAVDGAPLEELPAFTTDVPPAVSDRRRLAEPAWRRERGPLTEASADLSIRRDRHLREGGKIMERADIEALINDVDLDDEPDELALSPRLAHADLEPREGDLGFRTLYEHPEAILRSLRAM